MLHADDAAELQKACARAANQPNQTEDAGLKARTITLLWRQGKLQDALFEAQRAVKSFPSNGELTALMGKCYLAQTPPDYENADHTFKDARTKKLDAKRFVDAWAFSKLQLGEMHGLLSITDQPEIAGPALVYRFVGLYRIARERERRGDHKQAIETYEKLFGEAITARKRQLSGPGVAQIARLCDVVPDYLIEAAIKGWADTPAAADRIFDLAICCCSEGFPPFHYLRRIVSDFVATLKRRSTRGDLTERAHRRRVAELQTLRRALTELAESKQAQVLSEKVREAEKQVRGLRTRN